MGRIPQEIIDRILDRLDIVEVISEYIPLKKAGRNFKANCPFHHEKTPSFVVSPDKQIYHCFGCSAGGNVIGFVMNHESMDFPEAITLLAAKAGVELPEYRREDKKGNAPSLSARLYEVNRVAAEFYQNALRGERGRKALGYLKKRGINDSILSEFQIGYAEEGWESFKKYCVRKKIPGDLLRKSGLTIPSEKNRGDYDRFRNRIIFPVFNERGGIIAFGGRVMDDSLPKYINSPETAIYSKSNVLYGLNFSRRGIREKGHAIIVEGYMDVIIPFQYGITNVVAASGTALTPRQVDLLKKYTSTAVMVFDSDQAGEAASLRGLDILVENGMKVRIVTLPAGEDPDSFVRKVGKEKFENTAGTAKGLFEYKLDLLVAKLGIRDIGGIVDEMLPTIARVRNAVVQSDYLRRLAERLGVHEASLRHEMSKVKTDYSYHYEEKQQLSVSPHKFKNSDLHLLGLVILSRKSFSRVRDELGLDEFRDVSIRKVMKIAGNFFDEGEEKIEPAKLLSRLENDEPAKTAVVQALAKTDIITDPEKVLADCMIFVRRENRAEDLRNLTGRLNKARENRNDAEMMELVAKISRINKEKVA